MFKGKNTNTRTRWEIWSKLKIKAPEPRQLRRFGAFIAKFEHISHLALVFLLLTVKGKFWLGNFLSHFVSTFPFISVSSSIPTSKGKKNRRILLQHIRLNSSVNYCNAFYLITEPQQAWQEMVHENPKSVSGAPLQHTLTMGTAHRSYISVFFLRVTSL